MNKKKISCLILALGLTLSLAGCGCNGTTTNDGNTTGNVVGDGTNGTTTSDGNKSGNGTTTNDGNKTGNVVEEGANKVGNAVKEGTNAVVDTTESLVGRMTDTTMEYNKEDLKKALEKDGYKVEETTASQSHFSVDNKDFKVDGETISVYEYDANAADAIKTDLGTVTGNGAKINNKEVKWNKQGHIYKKGRLIVVYDGDNAGLIKSLNSALGNSLTQTNTTNTTNTTGGNTSTNTTGGSTSTNK